MTDILTLFSRDPLELTKEDIALIVEKMRESRKAFNLGNKKAGSTKPKTEKQQKLASLADKLDISL